MKTFYVSLKLDNEPSKEVEVKATSIDKDSRTVSFFKGKTLVDIFSLSQVIHAGETKISPEQKKLDPDLLSVKRLNDWAETLPKN